MCECVQAGKFAFYYCDDKLTNTYIYMDVGMTFIYF